MTLHHLCTLWILGRDERVPAPLNYSSPSPAAYEGQAVQNPHSAVCYGSAPSIHHTSGLVSGQGHGSPVDVSEQREFCLNQLYLLYGSYTALEQGRKSAPEIQHHSWTSYL